MKKKSEEIEVIELGTSYQLPKWRVVDGKGIVNLVDRTEGKIPSSEDLQKITFVRGDKSDNGQVIPRVDGILHEQLLGMMIMDLEHKNSLVPNEYTIRAIENLKSALKELEDRQKNREEMGVAGTYKK